MNSCKEASGFLLPYMEQAEDFALCPHTTLYVTTSDLVSVLGVFLQKIDKDA